MLKLQKTCKYFFTEFPFLFAHRLMLGSRKDDRQKGYTFSFAQGKNNWSCLKNIWLLNTLEIHMQIPSKFYSNIYKNDLRSLAIFHPITFEELKILTEAPIKKFFLKQRCFYENGRNATLQDLLYLILYANIVS